MNGKRNTAVDTAGVLYRRFNMTNKIKGANM